ncbi:MAG TPA: cytochrome c [Thermoanaerobaculia bacterium]|jgi:cytochrome c6|nr:cytochrome c [Thermoanaerobaculia bacterium]
MKPRSLVIALAALIVMLPLVALADATPDGATIFKSKCAMCHGPEGAGQTPTGKTMKVRDLRSADVQKLSDADLAKAIADGKGKMPSYKGKLTPTEIQVLVVYIRGLAKKK